MHILETSSLYLFFAVVQTESHHKLNTKKAILGGETKNSLDMQVFQHAQLHAQIITLNLSSVYVYTNVLTVIPLQTL